MSKFVTKNIAAVCGKLAFRQLVIVSDETDTIKLQNEIDDLENQGLEVELKGQLDLFEEDLEKKYCSSFLRIIGNMNRVANMQPLPEQKFKDVTPKNGLTREYEYKYEYLRCLAIKIPNGQLIVSGGYKNDQKRHFREFRSLVKQYIEATKL